MMKSNLTFQKSLRSLYEKYFFHKISIEIKMIKSNLTFQRSPRKINMKNTFST